MTVIYEWDVETVETYADGSNDVHDHHHFETYAEARAFSLGEPPEGCTYEVVLVRDDADRRSWAYLNADGTLPVFAHDAEETVRGRIPARYHAEVEASNRSDEVILGMFRASLLVLADSYLAQDTRAARSVLGLTITALTLTGRHTHAEATALVRHTRAEATALVRDLLATEANRLNPARRTIGLTTRARAIYESNIDGRTQP